MTHQRATVDVALQPPRRAAFGDDEFVGQESFMRASEIRALGARAGVGPGVRVLDLCCGVAGPGRFLTRELRCTYLGVDASASAVAVARERATGLDCRFEVAEVPPLPRGSFDVVLLLETILAFEDKQTLLREISEALTVGGRFVFTLEEGRPLTDAECERMPASDTVRLVPLAELVACLESVGLVMRWKLECSSSHQATADALARAYAAQGSQIAARLGHEAVDALVTSHRLWSDWLLEGRVRKFALIAVKERSRSDG